MESERYASREVCGTAEKMSASPVRRALWIRYVGIGVLMFVAIVFLSGCGLMKSAGNAAGSDDFSAVIRNDAADAFTIRVSAWFIDDRAVMQQFKTNVETAYKRLYPKATIQWEIKLDASYMDRLLTQLASDSGPDVIFNQFIGSLAESGYLADLSGEPWTGALIPVMKEHLTHKATKPEYEKYAGKIYAASMGIGARGYWYNKDLFARLGLSAPSTAGELLVTCEKIKEAGLIPIAVGFKDAWTIDQHFNALLQSVGYGNDEAYGLNLFEGKSRLDGIEVQTAMQFFQTLKDRQYMNQNALSIDWWQSADLFTSGKAAIIMQGPWMPGAAEDRFRKGDKPFSVGFFPVTDDNGYYDLLQYSDEYVSVNAKTRLLRQAKDLVAVMLGRDVYASFENGNGLLSAFEGMDVTYDNPAMEEVLSYSRKARSHSRWELYVPSSAMQNLHEEVVSIVSGVKFDPAQLKEAQKLVEEAKGHISLPLDPGNLLQ